MQERPYSNEASLYNPKKEDTQEMSSSFGIN